MPERRSAAFHQLFHKWKSVGMVTVAIDLARNALAVLPTSLQFESGSSLFKLQDNGAWLH